MKSSRSEFITVRDLQYQIRHWGQRNRAYAAHDQPEGLAQLIEEFLA